MKRYENLEIELQMLEEKDVITTSGNVTTDDIEVPWSGTANSAFEL